MPTLLLKVNIIFITIIKSTHLICSIVLPPVVRIDSEKELKVKVGKPVELFCSATGVGTEDFVYQWVLNGLPIMGQDTSTLVIHAVSEDNTGDYKCLVRNRYNAIGQSELVILVLGKWIVCFSKISILNVCYILDQQFCDPVTVNYSGFNITWNATQVGITVEVPCTGHGLNG